jgi:putrescine aminotransferase
MKAMHEQAIGLDYVHHINQPHWFEVSEPGEDPDSFGLRVARELEAKIDELGEDRVAAFIAEPVQGAGGVIIPPDSYWPSCSASARARHPADRRRGDLRLRAHRRVVGQPDLRHAADLMTFAKAVTNGYMPLGGVLISDKVADVLLAGGGEFAHGLTYSGHPASCAAGIATLRSSRDENIVECGKQPRARFQQDASAAFDHPIVGQVRGRGCFAALELVRDKDTRERLAPESAGAVFCRDTANDHGLMVRQTGDAMIMAPPLISRHEHIDYLIEKLGMALDATAEHYGVSG